ncbi:MAG TPA: alpha-amylase family glycosyl hydrolase [Candidatus Saccharimonadales bacterium]|nr:alpha-amylase family glycosyl hydrolase [Candidatus Saccharimonadales bacterium]
MDAASQPKLGAVAHKGGVSFGVWAPHATSVAVMGSFNEWSQTATPLARDDTGCWFADVSGAKVGQEYKYVIQNGEQTLLKNDPRALQLTASGDNSIIVSADFDWGDDQYELPPLNQQVIYELHLGTFHRVDPATPGTFETTAAKLDYLVELGVTTVELMPVSSTTVDHWWGYDPDYLYAVEASYGGRQAFLEFVKAAHARGIGVVVDVVYNHLSPYPGLDLWQFDGWSENGKGGIYFYNDWRGDTPWGARLDYGRPEVRQYISDNVRMWLQDCHVDGLRVDATFAIRNTAGRNDDPEHDLADGWKVLQEITTTAHQVRPTAVTIAEDIALNAHLTKPTDQGGAGFLSQWESSFPSALRNVLDPVDDASRQLVPLRDALAKHYNGDAFQRVVFSESHDADANGHARLNEEIDPGEADSLFARRRSALAAALFLTAPGVPMLFQGQEFMESGWFNHWQAVDWAKAERFGGILHLYKDLIALRLNQRDCSAGLLGHGFDTLHLDEKTKVLAYHRWDKGGSRDDVVVVVNFANQQQTGYSVAFPQSGTWKVRLNSDWQGYSPDFSNTPTPDVIVKDKAGVLNLAPYSVLILSQD